MEQGIILPPYSASSQRIGRMKYGPAFDSQYIARGHGMPLMTSGISVCKRAAVGRPLSTFLKARYSPLGVETFCSFSGLVPIFAANWIAAGVGWPSAPNATRLGGPWTISSVFGWWLMRAGQ